jgi:hypothetical protein
MAAMTVRPVAIKIDENTKARVKRFIGSAPSERGGVLMVATTRILPH